MKLFQTYQKLLPLLIGYEKLCKFGFNAPNLTEKYLCSITSKIGPFALAGGIIVTGGCVAFVAKTIQEYTANINMVVAAINDLIILVSLRWRFVKAFQLIKHCEYMVEERKYTFNNEVELING